MAVCEPNAKNCKKGNRISFMLTQHTPDVVLSIWGAIKFHKTHKNVHSISYWFVKSLSIRDM